MSHRRKERRRAQTIMSIDAPTATARIGIRKPSQRSPRWSLMAHPSQEFVDTSDEMFATSSDASQMTAHASSQRRRCSAVRRSSQPPTSSIVELAQIITIAERRSRAKVVTKTCSSVLRHAGRLVGTMDEGDASASPRPRSSTNRYGVVPVRVGKPNRPPRRSGSGLFGHRPRRCHVEVLNEDDEYIKCTKPRSCAPGERENDMAGVKQRVA